MNQVSPPIVKFRCPPELEPVLPRPIPAVRGLPEWLKDLPQDCFSSVLHKELMTIKKCPPFIDAMTYGFLMPLIADLKVENGEFSWDSDLPAGAITSMVSRSPIDFHDSVQVKGTPLFDEDQFVIKFHNFWTIELPPGYSLFVTHPANRADLPFTTLTGLVDSDLYVDAFISFPARWSKPDFNGVLPKGTPIAQCYPTRREAWVEQFEAMSPDDVKRLVETSNAVMADTGVYRRQFRAPKR